MAVTTQSILLIDDNQDLLSLLQLCLQRLGFQVLIANSGPKALAIMAREQVDVVVVDYKMPDMDGGQVAQEIRRVTPSMPILMYSGALEEPPNRVLELVDEFVSKQEPFSNLLHHIRNVPLRSQRRTRVLLRYPINLSFLVICDELRGGAVFYGESINMSEGGLGGILDEGLEIPVDARVLLRLAIFSQDALTARASLRHRTGRRYGFQFVDLTAAQLQAIRASLAGRVL
jgi:CheY-like chemotaxis protein